MTFLEQVFALFALSNCRNMAIQGPPTKSSDAPIEREQVSSVPQRDPIYPQSRSAVVCCCEQCGQAPGSYKHIH